MRFCTKLSYDYCMTCILLTGIHTCTTCRYDLIDLERGHGGYGGNVGDQWDAVSATDSSFTKDACFASGW